MTLEYLLSINYLKENLVIQSILGPTAHDLGSCTTVNTSITYLVIHFPSASLSDINANAILVLNLIIL